MLDRETESAEAAARVGTESAHPTSSVADSLYDIDSTDPTGLLTDRGGLTPEDVAQITRLMKSMAKVRDTEESLSKASQKFMQLSETEMRGIHYLIVASNQNTVVTPGAIAQHLGITSASTTKLLDRLERDEHIFRSAHPTDRRSLSISITPETHAVARDTVGRMHATRFTVAASLSLAQREIVTRFLDDIADRMTIRDESWATGTEPH